MASSMIDSTLFKNLFGTEEMRRVFSDENLLQKWLDVEAALAKAEGTLGIIEQDTADEIVKKAKVEYLDMVALGEAIIKANHPIMPLVKQLQKACDGEHGQFVHWGATTQDIMDTGVSLQLKEAFPIIKKELNTLVETLIELAEKYKATIMPGRTYGQHALPTTFGYKVSVWLEEAYRHIERVESLEKRVFVGEFFGAVGTLASLDKKGMEVQKLMMEDLGLDVPRVAWHTSRDNLAEIGSVMAIICGTVEKIANEIIILQKTETAELLEPTKKGQVGSSTMPHKRNPMTCSNISALSKLVRGNASMLVNSMVQEHERDLPGWQVEWQTIPEIFILADAALNKLNVVLAGLEVNVEKMRANTDITKGFVLSEKVMLALGAKVGRQDAHDVVHGTVQEAVAKDVPLLDVLLENEKMLEYFTKEELVEMMDPNNYLGLSVEMTEDAINYVKGKMNLK